MCNQTQVKVGDLIEFVKLFVCLSPQFNFFLISVDICVFLLRLLRKLMQFLHNFSLEPISIALLLFLPLSFTLRCHEYDFFPIFIGVEVVFLFFIVYFFKLPCPDEF